jgi:HSP20 family protein
VLAQIITIHKETTIMVHFRFPIRQLPVALQDFATDMETIVDQVFNQGDCKGEKCESSDANSTFRPAVDIYESENQFDFYMDLPGVKADAVKIEMLEGRLIVSGNRVPPLQGEGVSAHRIERTDGQFSRSIQLPKQLDVEKIEAHFDSGVLHVVLPKQPKPVARTIQIKTN